MKAIDLPQFKRPHPRFGFAFGDIVRPFGCNACGWYGIKANFHPRDAEFECPECSSRKLTIYPGIAPDMLQ